MEIPTKNLSSIAWLFFSVLMFASSLLFHGGIAVGDYKTLPIEVDALDSIFRKWNIPYKGNSNNGESWNINSTNPCKGFVVSDSNDESIDDSVRGKLQILCLCNGDTSFCNIIKLAVWDLDIVGIIPNELQNLTKLVYLDVTSNSFSGELPAFLWILSDLKMMYLSRNNFNGALPPGIGNLKNIKYLYLSHNNFNGALLPEIGNLKNIKNLYLTGNNFNGSLPSEIGNLKNIQQLSISKNKLNGNIPRSLWDLTNLEIFDLNGNSFQGSIPSNLGNLVNLKELDLSNNTFSGPLPFEIGNLKNIEYLSLFNNKFGGKIPKNLWNLKTLKELYIYDNNFNGSLPQEIENLKNLTSLYIYDNNFNGSLPKEIENLKYLTIFDLNGNSFQGSIPSNLGNLVNLKELDLSNNNFSGPLPSEIGNLKNIVYFYLNGNSFQGSIPSNLGKLVNLKELDLSYNNFTGSIPNILRQRQSQRLLNMSIEGNLGLCFDCGRSSSNKTMIVIIAVVFSIIPALTVIIFVIWKVKRNSRNSTSLGTISKEPIHAANKEFTYLELVTITSNFNKIIGKGGFGNVYYGIDQRNGSEVAVKMLSSSSTQGSKEFQMEAQILTRIHHKNLVSLVGYCIERDHLALVYEYMKGGSLKNLISGQCSNSTTISWGDRMRIALEIAQGLDYLHRECQPAIVHRDVKTTNILLSRYFKVKIADFGLSKIFVNDANSGLSTNVMGTFGYIDPEYYRTGKLNEKSDVYSFGIVLIELITGKPPIIHQAEDNIPIATWVEPMLENGEIDKIVDPNLNGKYNSNSAKKALEIAFACIPPTSVERLLMFDVVKQLNECMEIEIPQGSRSPNSIDYDICEDVTAPFAR